MRSRAFWIVAAALGSFALTFGVFLFLFWPRVGECDRDCEGLAYAAAFTWSIVLGSLLAAVAAFLVYVVLKSTAEDDVFGPERRA